MEYPKVLDEIKVFYEKTLQENLVGIYVHGSIAFGCFRWEKSDIDFLVVTRQEPFDAQKQELVRKLLELDRKGFCPPKGFEMSAVLAEHCRDFVYPTPYTLHYSSAYSRQCREDLPGFCQRMRGTDRDLAAHFTVLRAEGFALCGAPVQEVFGPVPKACYLDSILGDAKDAQQGIVQDPVYFILNLCRVLAYQREEKVLSKKDGGLWGLTALPGRYHPVVQAALSSYGGGEPLDLDPDRLRDFSGYLLGQIFPGFSEKSEKDANFGL
ncbi:MAG: DUF4111 domain-containing protein [Oscillospiraceae bacterium]|nr:DUF4111 domain-containing protein [Oscillospiraceae bacterium]